MTNEPFNKPSNIAIQTLWIIVLVLCLANVFAYVQKEEYANKIVQLQEEQKKEIALFQKKMLHSIDLRDKQESKFEDLVLESNRDITNIREYQNSIFRSHEYRISALEARIR